MELRALFKKRTVNALYNLIISCHFCFYYLLNVFCYPYEIVNVVNFFVIYMFDVNKLPKKYLIENTSISHIVKLNSILNYYREALSVYSVNSWKSIFLWHQHYQTKEFLLFYHKSHSSLFPTQKHFTGDNLKSIPSMEIPWVDKEELAQIKQNK